MEAQRKRIIIMAAALVAILGISYYSFWQKSAAPETVSYNRFNNQQAVASQSKDRETVVYISGGVNKPGVYKIASHLRVVDLINTAGGLAPGAEVAKINLAQQVKDGLHIYVPIAGDKSSSAASSAQREGKININTADKAALEKLPGIGAALADRIIQYRNANGAFRDIADIKKVSGIGEAKYNALKDKITT